MQKPGRFFAGIQSEPDLRVCGTGNCSEHIGCHQAHFVSHVLYILGNAFKFRNHATDLWMPCIRGNSDSHCVHHTSHPCAPGNSRPQTGVMVRSRSESLSML